MPSRASATTMAPTKTSPKEYAIQHLAPRRLHQCLWLPDTETHGKLRVTFSTTSNFEQDLPAILFVGPMFGTRYLASMFDRQAKIIGVRVICVDRPGFGGSSPVPLDQRMSTWLEIVPLLLQHLNIKHVSLVSHSAGTTFTLNTITRLRHILDPKAPYVAFLGPWVSPDHSKMTYLKAAAKLPSGLISNWAGLNQFIAQNLLPAASWSGGVSASLVDVFRSQAADSKTEETSYREKYDVDDDTGKAIENLGMDYVFAEGISGGNDEARLCLHHASWDACDDYTTCMKNLAEAEKAQAGEGRKLTVKLHFAASDIMIGEKGKEYFEACWRQEGIDESIDVESKQWVETNHETVLLDFKKGAIRSVFEDVRRFSGL